ncbi:sulfotransferase [Tropicimonas sp. IMCC6043]|uniref:tetratricopeptide repeat-containing sulfotransferase family protein n=1 Tax=Tropicimonas sp. IMCC6043 TaxID=2510645 RepID=UPI0013EB1252|nr:sulfotransferase [Tropicimonas sp. IMCC6043]
MLPLDSARIKQDFTKALALQKAGRLAEAQTLLERLVAATPSLAEAHFQLARIARQQGRIDAAISHLEHARAVRPTEPAILSALGELLAAQGQFDAATAVYDPLIAAAPKNPSYRVEKALVLQLAGDFDAAEAELQQALKLDPLRGEPYRMLVANRKIAATDPLIGRMKKALANPKLTRTARVQIEFAMAKAMEDSKRHDAVFRYLRPANAAMKKAYGYDVSERRDEVDRLIAAFAGHDFTPTRPEGPGFTPIFVTGLPRSGTTLVEQILASHSQVTGGGEMRYALQLSYGAIRKPDGSFRAMSELDAARIAQLGADYEAALRGTHEFGRAITDKSIQSHLVMGLLKQAIPSARFVVVRRDPRDGLYSIYKNMFAQGTHRYAYDLEDLAAYYATFLKMLDFWRGALPGGFHEIRYEDLVADPEQQTRALIAAVGLDWEDACLEFHKSKGPVRTLSVAQVRQPIYRSSSALWRTYEKDLAPLVAALEREGVELDGA